LLGTGLESLDFPVPLSLFFSVFPEELDDEESDLAFSPPDFSDFSEDDFSEDDFSEDDFSAAAAVSR
jgi:hypothetical protein